MRKTKIIYWVLTILFAGAMAFSGYPDVVMDPAAVAGIMSLGYPLYFIPFIGVAKILGAIAIITPGHSRLKEWAYAGLSFDLIGAMYSMYSVGVPFKMWFWVIILLAVGFLSYVWYHKYRKISGK